MWALSKPKTLICAQMNKPDSFKKWLKRLGIGGFIFFTVKGLIWLFILFGVGKCVAG